MEATNTTSRSVETELSSVKDRLRAIEAELGITSTAVVGNTNHAPYEERITVESHLHGQLMARQGQLLALLQDQSREALTSHCSPITSLQS